MFWGLVVGVCPCIDRLVSIKLLVEMDYAKFAMYFFLRDYNFERTLIAFSLFISVSKLLHSVLFSKAGRIEPAFFLLSSLELVGN